MVEGDNRVKPQRERPFVATIGVFDGVHRGHQALLGAVRESAIERGLDALVIGFDPHPVRVLAKTPGPSRLTSRRQQVAHFCELGLQRAWFLPFSRQLAELEPEAFVSFLRSHVSLELLWVGHDFRFGRARRGDFRLLQQMGRELGFLCAEHEALLDAGRPISSSWIRQLLKDGEIPGATALLGHSYLLEAPVVSGRGEGARLLVPTANLGLDPEQCLPARGVYAGWAEIDGRLLPAAVNVGVRPTLTDDTVDTVEFHVLDWSGDLGGRRLRLHFVQRLRTERKFDGLAALRAQVDRDIQEVRGILSRTEAG